MTVTHPPVSDLILTVKSREIQRALQAEHGGDRGGAVRHYLAAAHLELVLAEDYQTVGEQELARRSRLSAASCLWRAGRPGEAREHLEALCQNDPASAAVIQQMVTMLEQSYPP